MKKVLPLLLVLLQLACTGKTGGNDTNKVTESQPDSALLAEVQAVADVPGRKVVAFNDVAALRKALGSVGIGEMRKWWNDGTGWLSASNFYEFGSPGTNGLTANLAFYLESPSEAYVESLKVKLNINNIAEKRTALSKYASTVEKTFKVIGLTMPKGLKEALLRGKPYKNDDKQRTTSNVLESGHSDSWMLQIISH